MLLCPVDLEPCLRVECSGGMCKRANAAKFAICWECGAVEIDRFIAGMCVACVASTAVAAIDPEE